MIGKETVAALAQSHRVIELRRCEELTLKAAENRQRASAPLHGPTRRAATALLARSAEATGFAGFRLHQLWRRILLIRNEAIE
jgi:hypothetical protein